MSITSAVIRETAVDWITATAKNSDRVDALLTLGRNLLAFGVSSGDIERMFDWRGYKLHRAGHVAYGQRPSDAMIQLSGSIADTYANRATSLSDHIARLDLQVTARVARDTEDHGLIAYMRASTEQFRSGRRTSFSHVQSSNGGSTLYAGSRQSDQMGRLYNKWAESGDEMYRGCWRYEVELKNDLATSAALRLMVVSDRRSFIAGFIHRWFEQRGIVPVFDSDSPVDLQPPLAVPSDAEKQLLWLKTQVAGTVKRLRAAGLTDKVLSVLELSDLVDNPGDPHTWAANGNHGGDLEGV